MEKPVVVTRAERTLVLTSSPDTISEIFELMCNGGCLLDWCTSKDVKYSDIMLWIIKDDERKKLYDESVRARGEWFVQKVLLEIKRIGTIDLRTAFDDHGCLHDMKELSDDLAACISRVEVFEEYQGHGKDREYIGRTKKVFFWDKMKALELLGKQSHMFAERLNVDVNIKKSIKLIIPKDKQEALNRIEAIEM